MGDPPSKQGHLVFQLGTNNWQRQGEFAPGSGILHEVPIRFNIYIFSIFSTSLLDPTQAHHAAINATTNDAAANTAPDEIVR